MLRGAIDTHIHTAPDVVPRKLSLLELARMAAAKGMRAIVVKSHQYPTYPLAAVAREAVPEIDIFGGIVLNAQVGGINPVAVETAFKIGAKFVWLPTVSSLRSISLAPEKKETPVPVFDEAGKPAPGLMDVFELIAKADGVLGTGHLTPEEIRKVVSLAKQAGVKKITITHPESRWIGMSVEVQKELAAQGAFFERCFFATNSAQKLPVEVVADQIREVGWQSTVLATDFGQDFNLPAPEGLELFLKELARCGIPQKHLEACVKDHPAALLGL